MKKPTTKQKQLIDMANKAAAETALWSSKKLADNFASKETVKAAKSREAQGLLRVAIKYTLYQRLTWTTEVETGIASELYDLTRHEIKVLKEHCRTLAKQLDKKKEFFVLYDIIYMAPNHKVSLPLELYNALKNDE